MRGRGSSRRRPARQRGLGRRELDVEAGERGGQAAALRLIRLELVEVLDELAAQVGFVAGDGGEMGGVEEEAFASDARYHGFEVRRGVFEAEDLGPDRDENELGRVPLP